MSLQPICGIEGLFGVSDSMGEQLNNELTRRSLWLGDLASWMDEGFLFNLFLNTRQLMSVKLIRNRSSGQSEGYAFLEFSSPEAAANVLALFNGQVIPGTDQIFRLNWAAYGVGKTASAGEGADARACAFVIGRHFGVSKTQRSLCMPVPVLPDCVLHS